VDLEKKLQKLFEDNLDEILNIDFLAHEYSTGWGGRMDTLGIDKNGAPAIIEYKKNQNDSIINQGIYYLSWLMDHKADFENLCRSKNIDIEIDWDSPRIICVAESYNKFDINTASFLPINIELLKYRIYENDLLSLDSENYQRIKNAMSGVAKKSKKGKQDVLEKNYTFTLDFHLEKASKETKSLFYQLREMIMVLDETIIEEAKSKYIAYKTSTNFADVVVLRNSLKLFLNIKSGQLKDPYKIARDLTKPKPIGHWGNGDYEIKVDNENDLNKIFDLIQQSYSYNK
jgi:predicted transport protein